MCKDVTWGVIITLGILIYIPILINYIRHFHLLFRTKKTVNKRLKNIKEM